MNRSDGLPNPVTVSDMYLAAILDELRSQGRLAPVPESEITVIKEPINEQATQKSTSGRRK